jgi:hypothetical protein
MEIEERVLFCLQNKAFHCERAFQFLVRSKSLSQIFIWIGILQLWYTGCNNSYTYYCKHALMHIKNEIVFLWYLDIKRIITQELWGTRILKINLLAKIIRKQICIWSLFFAYTVYKNVLKHAFKCFGQTYLSNIHVYVSVNMV